jgi:N-acetylglutamate synthase-like GNAT family acetyltransferase
MHVKFYSEEFGYNEEFGEYVKTTLEECDRPLRERERVWIVEMEGEIIGCIAVIEHSDDKAQIRWFLVNPKMRGHGIGSRLFQEAVDFMEKSRYNTAFLYTQDILHEAAVVYKKFGFRLVEEHQEEKWGQTLLSQKYERRFFRI